MRNELEKFHHTVDILVKAYLNDTLQNMNCYACAVGNLVAHVNGYKFDNKSGRRSSDGRRTLVEWVDQPYPVEGWYACIRGRTPTIEGIEQIRSTGYSIEELRDIENAFETECDLDGSDETIFNGLMAVVDVLADIHQVDLTIKEEAKLLFVK